MNGSQESQKLESALNVNQLIGIKKDESSIPYGYCHCGCGRKTAIADRNNTKHNYIKGLSRKYINGHNTKNQDHKRNNNPHWKGGKINRNGYIKVFNPEHPRSDSKGYVYEHTLVAEKALGKYLPPQAVVHHFNKIRNDNSKGNLIICENNAYHRIIHARQNRIALLDTLAGNARSRRC
jgi:hypothetical protein